MANECELIHELSIPDEEMYFGNCAKEILNNLASNDDESTTFDELSDNWEN